LEKYAQKSKEPKLRNKKGEKNNAKIGKKKDTKRAKVTLK